MSQSSIVGAISTSLAKALWAGLEFAPDISSIISSENQVSLEPPFRLFSENAPNQNALSVYLYRVVENPDLKNRPPFANPAPDYSQPPLALTCSYLVTPLTESAVKDQKLLARAMQILYDNAIMTVDGNEIRISLDALSLEDMTKLWSSFVRPFRLSVVYQVRVVLIDSERSTRAERVVRKQLEFEPMEPAP